MRKQVLLPVCFLITALFMVTIAADMRLVFAQTDFTSYSGTAIADNEIDGALGSEWDDAGKYSNVAINPSGTADVWTKHDETYLYVALRFMADSNNPWVGFQFLEGNCMREGADGALFGNDRFSANGYQDVVFGGTPFVVGDSVQDGIGAINVDSSNLVTVEMKKPLNSNHTNESDIAWTAGNQYGMIIIWDSDGEGSSGGATDHMGGSRATKTMLISTEAIPEFSTMGIIAALVAVLGLAATFKLKNRRKHKV